MARPKSRKRGSHVKKQKAAVPPLMEDIEFEDVMRDATAVEEVLEKETDRGCALVGGAALEQVLGGLLNAFIVNDRAVAREILDSPNAAGRTFSARTHLCRGIGLLSGDLYHDINSVRYIRNQAAHFDFRRKRGFNFTFEREDIAARCREFRSVPKDCVDLVGPREIFQILVVIVVACLAEYAICSRMLSINVGESFSREMLLELVPKMKISRYIKHGFREEGLVKGGMRRPRRKRRS